MSRIRLSAIVLLLTALADPAAPAEPAWMRTARVFLIDAYQPPFAPELEFDAAALATTMAKMNANVVRFATMGKYATIQGVRFSTHPKQGQRDLLAEMIAAAKPRGIRVIPYISTGHKLAWSMVTERYPEYAQRTGPGGGPDRSHMFVGEDMGTVCWNTPYRQAYLDLIEHVVRDYDIDGLYFDTWRPHYFWPGLRLCYCDGCRDGFREASGHEIPWHEERAGYTAAELEVVEQYHRWYREELIEVIGAVRRIAKSHRDIPLIYNINDPPKLAAEDPRVIEAMDAFLYERGETMLERAEGVSLARASGMGIWPYVGGYDNWPRLIFGGLELQQEIYTTVMFGGAPIIAQPYAFVERPESRAPVAGPFALLKDHEDELAGFENVPYAAVVYGYRNPPDHRRAGWWWKTDARSATLGAFAACLYGHVQVSSIHENVLDRPEALSRYRVIYLADIAEITATRVANLEAYVRNGGGLIVSYGTSLYDAAGERRTAFALEDLVRVKPLEPSAETASTLEKYTAMIGGPNDLYLLSRAGSNPLGPKWSGQLVPAWFYEPVETLDGGEVIADIVTGDGRRPVVPGVVMSRHGQGRVLYCASSLESLFGESNNRLLGDYLKTLVELAAGAPPPYEVDAPSSLIANLTASGGRLVLHLANWTGNKLERKQANAYYLAPAYDVIIRLQIPAGKKVESVKTFIDDAPTFERKDRRLTIRLPRVDAYQAIVIDLEAGPRRGGGTQLQASPPSALRSVRR